MGASHSSGEESLKRRKVHKKAINAYKQSLDKFKHNQVQKNGKAQPLNWKEDLIGLLNPDLSNLQYWNELKKLLISCVESEKDGNGVWWIANFQRMPLTFSTYNSQLQMSEDNSVLDFNKLEEEKTPYDLSPRDKSNVSSFFSSTLASSPSKHGVKGSMAFSDPAENRPATYQLKLNLRTQINNPKHIVFILIQEFLGFFSKTFSPQTIQLQKFEITVQQVEKSYYAAKKLIKHFVGVLKDFIIMTYRSLMEHFISGLNQENFNVHALVEDVIYEMLFSDTNLPTYQFIFTVLKQKHANNMQKLNQNIEKMIDSTLDEQDDEFKDSLLLLKGKKPMYGRVIRKFRKMRNHSSPYKKYNEIITLSQEIAASISSYYKEDHETIQKAGELLTRDPKTSIITYCIIQSKNTSLVIDREFIQEFVEPSCLEAFPDFPTFCISVGYLLTDHAGEKENK